MERNVISHSGKLGQRWYIRNGPPYPLRSSQVSASERNAASEAGKPYVSKSARQLEKLSQKKAKLDEKIKVIGERKQLQDARNEYKRQKASIKQQKIDAKAAQKEAKRQYKADKKRVKSESRKKASMMTDAELKSRTQRLKDEEEYYRTLHNVRNRYVSKGKAAVSEVLMNSAKNAGQTVTTAAMTYYGKKAVTRLVGDDVAKEMFKK